MKLNRNTIFLLIVALSLTGAVFFSEIRRDGFNLTTDNTQETEISLIFPFQIEAVKEIDLTIDGNGISFAKIGSNPHPWMMINPEKTKASDAAIAFLLNLFPRAQKKIELLATDNLRQEYGINANSPTITITLEGRDRYQIILGKPNFDDTQIYAEVIFPEKDDIPPHIYLISKSFQYALERDFDEWKNNEQ